MPFDEARVFRSSLTHIKLELRGTSIGIYIGSTKVHSSSRQADSTGRYRVIRKLLVHFNRWSFSLVLP